MSLFSRLREKMSKRKAERAGFAWAAERKLAISLRQYGHYDNEGHFIAPSNEVELAHEADKMDFLEAWAKKLPRAERRAYLVALRHYYSEWLRASRHLRYANSFAGVQEAMDKAFAALPEPPRVR